MCHVNILFLTRKKLFLAKKPDFNILFINIYLLCKNNRKYLIYLHVIFNILDTKVFTFYYR